MLISHKSTGLKHENGPPLSDTLIFYQKQDVNATLCHFSTGDLASGSGPCHPGSAFQFVPDRRAFS